jgi:hypothetical protein
MGNLVQVLRNLALAMNAEEKDIYNFLKSYRDVFVSVVEVSRRLGARGRRFQYDRTWARPILMRMQMDGLVESNEFGEFRIRCRPEDTDFVEALKQADLQVPLGDTTIIRLDHLEEPCPLEEDTTLLDQNSPQSIS